MREIVQSPDYCKSSGKGFVQARLWASFRTAWYFRFDAAKIKRITDLHNELLCRSVILFYIFCYFQYFGHLYSQGSRDFFKDIQRQVSLAILDVAQISECNVCFNCKIILRYTLLLAKLDDCYACFLINVHCEKRFY